MPFVKLDCGILRSSLWTDTDARNIFITALLMAEPYELTDPTPTICIDSLDAGDYVIPAGWYGLVKAAGVGILRQAGHDDKPTGIDALKRLSTKEQDSRTQTHDGRRLVRIDGGYIVLNYMLYRERDETGAERMRRYRAKQRHDSAQLRVTDTPLRATVTQAEAEAEAEADPSLSPQKGEGAPGCGERDKSLTGSGPGLDGLLDKLRAVGCPDSPEIIGKHVSAALHDGVSFREFFWTLDTEAAKGKHVWQVVKLTRTQAADRQRQAAEAAEVEKRRAKGEAVNIEQQKIDGYLAACCDEELAEIDGLAEAEADAAGVSATARKSVMENARRTEALRRANGTPAM